MLAKYIALALLLTHTCHAITHGDEVRPHQYPHQVAIYTECPLLGIRNLVCGGVILNRNWILTSAQCIYLFKNLIVKAGKHELSVTDPMQEIRTVKYNYKHPQYKRPGWFRGISKNDIALLKLNKPLIFNEHIQPIALPTPGATHTGVGWLTGWGGDGRTSETLEAAEVSFLDVNNCTRLVKKRITNDQICSGVIGGVVSACSKDLGGPVIQYRPNTSPQLVGIVSWTDHSCRKGVPTVYTKVSAYVGWIQKTFNKF
ncbi:coagulation factor IX [Fopius arisanus]|uniref:Coagulation factor IX n=1 Tax=Fopius arisanus TaxID=64838 RepID=A0A9R1TWW8_9HYME|nr:PREDICTED: coagulation factor IX-like [Fopius arisanus]